jgi:hypothetical protein
MKQEVIEAAARRLGKNVIKTSTGESFVVGKLLGEGGMGRAYTAQSLRTGKGAVYKRSLEEILEKEERGIIIFGRALNAESRKEVDAAVNASEILFGRAKQYKVGSRFMHYEAEMQAKAFAKAPHLVPQMLGKTRTGFVQEFAGRGVRPEEIPAAKEFIQKTFPELAEQAGILHLDPAAANLVKTPNGFKVIDWGNAIEKGGAVGEDIDELHKILSKRAITPREANRAKEYADTLVDSVKDKTGVGRPRAAQKRIASATDVEKFLTNWYNLHEKTQIMAGNMARRAGKKHLQKAGKIIQ